MVVISLSMTLPVWADVVAPTVTTNEATYIAYSTVRLNAIVTYDGGESCSVRFQYRESGGDWTDNETAWVEGYTTDMSPYLDIDSLTSDTLHNARVQIKNSHSTVTGASISFTTSASVAVPTNLKAYPNATSILLTWTKGVGGSNTLIRYSENTYPTSETSGIEAYSGFLSSYTISSLESGHTYYISGWGESGDTLSGTYVTVQTTTTAEVEGLDPPDQMETPSSWFQTPNYTNMNNMPGYTVLNGFFTSQEIPLASGWFLLALGGIAGSGILVLILTKGSVMAAFVTIATAFAISGTVELVPMWMFSFTAIFGIGAVWIGGRP